MPGIGKLNPYKITNRPNIRQDDIRKAEPGVKSLVTQQRAQLTALNRIGLTLNSIGKSLQGIYGIELKNLKEGRQKTRRESFTPAYTTGAGFQKPPGFKSLYKGRGVGDFWKGLLSILGGLLKFLIIRPVLQWLADPANQEKVKGTLETFKKIFLWVYQFTQSRVIGIVDGLYDFFNDQNTWQTRLGGFMRGFGNLGVLLLGLRWLSNPMRIITDLRSVLTFFYNRLRGAKARLTGGATTAAGSSTVKPKTSKLKTGAKIGAAGLIGLGGLFYTIGEIQRRQEESEAVQDMQGSEIDELIQGFQESTIAFEESYLNALPEQSKGGRYKRRGRRPKGGWITGPQSGYPVSLDGKGVDFIGHGTEYVSQKPGGDAFIVPYDTPHTRKNPLLTNLRLNEALGKGYEFSEGGQYVPDGGWVTGPMSGYPVSVKGTSRPDFIAHGTEYVAKNSIGDFSVIPFHKGVSTDYSMSMLSMAQSAGYKMPSTIPGKITPSYSNVSYDSSPVNAPPMFIGGLVKGIGNVAKSIFGGGSSSSGSSGGGGGGFFSNIASGIGSLFGGGNKSNTPAPTQGQGGGFFGNILGGLGNLFGGMGGGAGKDTTGVGPVASGDAFAAMKAGSDLFGFDYKDGAVTGDTFLPGLFRQAGGIGAKFDEQFGGNLGGSIGKILSSFSSIMDPRVKDGQVDLGTLLKGGLGVISHFFKDKKGVMGKIAEYADIFGGPGSEKLTFGEKLTLAAKKALHGTDFEKYVGPIADALGVNIDNVTAAAGALGLPGSGGYSSPYDVPGHSPLPGSSNNPGVAGGGIRAAVDVGKWALSQGLTVMGHPNFRNNKWSEFGPNTGVGYSSAGKEHIGNAPRGSLRSMGLGLDVKDYRPEGNTAAVLQAFAEDAYGARTGKKITQVAYDGWGVWTAGQKRQRAGNYGYPDSVFLGVAQEAKDSGGPGGGIFPGSPEASGVFSQLFTPGMTGATDGEKLVAARTLLNQNEIQEKKPGGILGWLGDAVGGIFKPKETTEEQDKEAEGIFRMAADSDSFISSMKMYGLDEGQTASALNATNFSFGNSDLTNSFNLGEGIKPITFGTDDNTLFNASYRMPERDKALTKGGGTKITIGPMGGVDTNKNQTPTKGTGSGPKGRMPETKGIGLTGSSDLFKQVAGIGADLQQGQGSNQDGGQQQQGNMSNVKSLAPGETVKQQFENREQESKLEVTKEKNAARSQLQQKNAQTMSAMIAQVQANNDAVKASVAKAHAVISNLINQAGKGGDPSRTAGDIASAMAGIQSSTGMNRAAVA